MSAAGNGKIPELLANEAVTAVLKTQWDGEPAVRLDSPPGAGRLGSSSVWRCRRWSCIASSA